LPSIAQLIVLISRWVFIFCSPMAALRRFAAAPRMLPLLRPVCKPAYHTDAHLNILKTVTQLNSAAFKENAAQMSAAVADLRGELHRIQLGAPP
jgi:hypothetical protein